MKHVMSLLTASVVGLTATTAFAQYYTLDDIQGAMQLAGKKVFADRCAVCHVKKAGGHPLGPNLVGVVGRAAGSDAKFPYSDAMKKSGLTWTDDNLRKWIADPSHVVPNTAMPHVALADPAEQLYVIAYLKTLPAKPR